MFGGKKKGKEKKNLILFFLHLLIVGKEMLKIFWIFSHFMRYIWSELMQNLLYPLFRLGSGFSEINLKKIYGAHSLDVKGIWGCLLIVP